MQKQSQDEPLLSDSIWFWLTLFGLTSVVLLALFARRIDARQAQIDRNYVRRMVLNEQRAKGQTEDSIRTGKSDAQGSPQDQPEDDGPSDRRIGYGSLIVVVAVLTIVCWHMSRRDLANRRKRREAGALS